MKGETLAQAIDRMVPVLESLLAELRRVQGQWGPRIVKTDDGHEMVWPDGLSIELADDDDLFRYIATARNRAVNAERTSAN